MVILYMATSINGMIAHENEGEDFLSYENWDTLRKLAQKYGTFVVGRRTYEIVKGWGPEYNFDEFKKTNKIILSTDLHFKTDPGYIVCDSPESVLGLAEKNRYKNILVIGGSRTSSSFLEKGFIDEIVINIEPVIVGKGIPMVHPVYFDYRLKLVSVDKTINGLVTLSYKVIKK